MTINYGRRSLNDTLYIPFASYNDSGDSEALSGLAVTDIEIFKNGVATARATDSGYSVISDTGQYGDIVGLYRVSVQLFNTSDDTGFFDAGSQYHMAISSVTIDGKTVSFFPAIWEIDTTVSDVYAKVDTGISAEITAIDATTAVANLDTGLNETVDRTYAKLDTGISAEITAIDATTAVSNLSNKTDTGVPASVWAEATRTLTALGANFIDTGTYTGVAAAANDTGALEAAISAGVWSHASRELTGFAFDTGIQQALARVDTGLSETIDRAYAKVDTGISAEIALVTTNVSAKLDTGGMNVDRLSGDTGALSRMFKWAGTKVTDSGTFDTGVGNLGATISSPDVNITSFLGDTGSAAALRDFANEADTGRIQAEATATLDTGKIQQAVWGYVQDYADTGFLDRFRKWGRDKLTDSGTFDTGTGATGGTSTADTGAIADAVWAYATRSLTASLADTGAIADAVWAYATRGLTTMDTGNVADAVWAYATRQNNVAFDTGILLEISRLSGKVDTGVGGNVSAAQTAIVNKLDTGVLADMTTTGNNVDTGIIAEIQLVRAELDTGIANNVWTFATRTLTSAHDTGVLQRIDRLDTGMTETIDLTLVKLDTGVTGGTVSLDTGQMNQAVWGADASRTLTGWAFDTGVQQRINRLDTGLKSDIAAVTTNVNLVDTGLTETIDRIYSKVDTGISAEITAIDATTTANNIYAKVDTGISAEISAIDTTTAVSGISAKLDTGVPADVDADILAVTSKLDTGVSAEITAVSTAVSQADTGVRQILDKVQFDTGGNEIHVDIRKVNNVQVAGTGDTGLNDAWGPV